MSASKVYLCPSCQSVIRSDRDVSEGLKCDSCGSSFGGSGSGTAAPKRTRSESSASPSILRDVMKNREGIVLPVSFGSTEKLGNFKSEKLAAAAEGSRDEESILSDGSRQVKRRKKRRKEEKHKKLYIFITAWVGVIVALLFIFQIKSDDGKTNTANTANTGMPPWKREFYRSHLESISKNYNSFIQALSLPAKQQAIDRSSQMAAKFSRFNQTHSSPVLKER
jgi:ribosomal protein L37AE/L43A